MKIKLKDLAAAIGANVEGDENIIIESFGPIENAGQGTITFLANPKYAHHIYATEASAVLVSNEFQPEAPIKATLLRVADPYSTLAELMTMAERMQRHLPEGIEPPCRLPEGFELPEDAYIGAFAYISDGVKIAKGVKIFPQVYIGRDVEIGAGTQLRPGVKIYDGCKIGCNCIIHAGAVIGGDGFGFAPKDGGYEKIPQTGNVVIEDNVEIGSNTTIDRATFGSTRIGRGTKLDNLIQVAHNVEIGHDNVFAAQTGIAGSTHIGDQNMVGGQVGFAGHITIGSHNQIGAQSGIHAPLSDGQKVMGYPAVDWRTFARQTVYLKKLESLFTTKK